MSHSTLTQSFLSHYNSTVVVLHCLVRCSYALFPPLKSMLNNASGFDNGLCIGLEDPTLKKRKCLKSVFFFFFPVSLYVDTPTTVIIPEVELHFPSFKGNNYPCDTREFPLKEEPKHRNEQAEYIKRTYKTWQSFVMFSMFSCYVEKLQSVHVCLFCISGICAGKLLHGALSLSAMWSSSCYINCYVQSLKYYILLYSSGIII